MPTLMGELNPISFTGNKKPSYRSIAAGGFFHTASKGQKHKSHPPEPKAAIPEKEALHSNDAASLEHYIQLVEEWIELLTRHE